MAVTQNDIRSYRSAAGASAGGTRSAVEITSTKNSLFEDVSDAERTAGGSKQKKWFLANISGSETWSLPVVWIDTLPTNCTEQLGYAWDDAEDDDLLQGNMVAWSANAQLTIQSDGADTRQVEIVGKDAAGVACTELMTLNGTSLVTSTLTYSAVYGCRVLAVSASRIISIKQVGIGTNRGSIGLNFKTCWLWLSPTSKANGFRLITLPPGAEHGFWDKITWAPAAGAIDPNSSIIAAEAA